MRQAQDRWPHPDRIFDHPVLNSKAEGRLRGVQVEMFRVRKYSKFKEFRQLIAEQWGIPEKEQFWWPWERRMNHTYRPSKESR